MSRAQNKRETRASLQAAALDLFSRRGFDAVTSQEIAAASGVSERTFFRYFPTKDSTVLWYVEDDAALAFGDADRVTPDRDLIEAKARWAAYGDEDRKILLARTRLIAAHPLLRAQWLDKNWTSAHKVADAVSALKGHGAAAKRDTRVLASAVFAASCVAVQQWATAAGKGSLDGRLNEAFAQLRRGEGPAAVIRDGRQHA